MVRSLMPRSLLLPSLWDDDVDWPSLSTQTSGLSLSEDDKHIYVQAQVPGVDPKNIDVTYHDGYLWIRGEAKESEEDKKRKYYRHATSSFSYRVAIPSEVDMKTEPEATYKHGVMTVTFAKSPKAQPKKITVKAKE